MNINYKKSPQKFFDLYHAKHDNEKDLINPNWEWYQAKYHYNLVENGIINLLMNHFGKTITNKKVLDIGAGSGHWIYFFKKFISAKHITAIDLSNVAINRLRKRYNEDRVTLLHADVSKFKKEFQNQFDIICAIGILFHIVDDDLWEKSITNLCKYLENDGICIVGGDFTQKTETISHHRRVRSIDCWEKVLSKNTSEIVDIIKFEWFDGVGTSRRALRDNLLAFRVKNE